MKLITILFSCMLISSCSVGRQVIREGAGYTARAIMFLTPSIKKSSHN